MPYVLLLALLCGCVPSDDDASDRNYISFTPSGNQSTRATPTTATNITSFGVSCSLYPSASTYTSAGCGSYFYNERINTSAGNSSYFWPGSSYKVSFFAYQPYGNSALTLSSSRNKTGYPTYAYTVPSQVGAQLDFMTADVLNQAGTPTKTPVSLNFHHRLTDIRFTVTNENPTSALTLKSITILGMKYAGTFEGSAWTLTGSANTVSQNPFIFNANQSIAASGTVDVTGTTYHFMILPQTVAAGTTFLTVKTAEGGEEHTYTHVLTQNLVLQQGKSYMFHLTLGGGPLIVDPVTAITDWEIGQQNIEEGKLDVHDWL